MRITNKQLVYNMEIIKEKKPVFKHTTAKKYTSKEVERMKKIVDYVIVESENKDKRNDFNDWGNHSEYTRGW
ncbi:MAG: hypothetical protein IJ150_09890 [Bacteroidales bacterium]|nr:hypothetical protein [Bacteroidales bacterium]